MLQCFSVFLVALNFSEERVIVLVCCFHEGYTVYYNDEKMFIMSSTHTHRPHCYNNNNNSFRVCAGYSSCLL